MARGGDEDPVRYVVFDPFNGEVAFESTERWEAEEFAGDPSLVVSLPDVKKEK